MGSLSPESTGTHSPPLGLDAVHGHVPRFIDLSGDDFTLVNANPFTPASMNIFLSEMAAPNGCSTTPFSHNWFFVSNEHLASMGSLNPEPTGTRSPSLGLDAVHGHVPRYIYLIGADFTLVNDNPFTPASMEFFPVVQGLFLFEPLKLVTVTFEDKYGTRANASQFTPASMVVVIRPTMGPANSCAASMAQNLLWAVGSPQPVDNKFKQKVIGLVDFSPRCGGGHHSMTRPTPAVAQVDYSPRSGGDHLRSAGRLLYSSYLVPHNKHLVDPMGTRCKACRPPTIYS